MKFVSKYDINRIKRAMGPVLTRSRSLSLCSIWKRYIKGEENKPMHLPWPSFVNVIRSFPNIIIIGSNPENAIVKQSKFKRTK